MGIVCGKACFNTEGIPQFEHTNVDIYVPKSWCRVQDSCKLTSHEASVTFMHKRSLGHLILIQNEAIKC